MDATTEIDKSGRLVVPKKLRDALHLVPGTRLTLRQEGRGLVIQPDAKHYGLSRKNGLLIFEFDKPLPPDQVNWVDQDREERIRQIIDPDSE